jgi:HEAT repeat protein
MIPRSGWGPCAASREIGDPASADIFARFLDAPDERLRAFAVRGLARIGDARASDALVRTIDDYPDVLHHLFTLAVVELIALGHAALPLVVPLLSAPDADTRVRAFLVIRRIVEANPRLRSWETLAAVPGPYDPGAGPSVRPRRRFHKTNCRDDAIKRHGAASQRSHKRRTIKTAPSKRRRYDAATCRRVGSRGRIA